MTTKPPRKSAANPRTTLPRTSGPLGELQLIQYIRKISTKSRNSLVKLGIGDDCAILHPPPSSELLVTTDFSLENRHFRRATHPPEAVGHRTIARGISDLAAMGATPAAAFLSLALPASLTQTPSGKRWISRFFSGLQALAQQHNITLAGGDTSESPADLILADIVLLGYAPQTKALRRSTARPGDLIYVTGALAGSAAELALVLASPGHAKYNKSKPRSHPHLFPWPRIAVGQYLLKHGLATSAIDISDGISTDMAHICEASGVSAHLDAASLPIHPLAAKLHKIEALRLALHGGEDYELLFTASPITKIPNKIAGVPITQIGEILPKKRGNSTVLITEIDGKTTELKPGGWQHFAP